MPAGRARAATVFQLLGRFGKNESLVGFDEQQHDIRRDRNGSQRAVDDYLRLPLKHRDEGHVGGANITQVTENLQGVVKIGAGRAAGFQIMSIEANRA